MPTSIWIGIKMGPHTEYSCQEDAAVGYNQDGYPEPLPECVQEEQRQW